jgi:glycosyltransferase involved in cell wall biosynthesis
MIQGVPVAGSTRGAIPIVLDHGRCGLLFEPTALDIQHAIQEAIGNPAALAERASLAKAFAQTNFEHSTSVRRYIELYRSCRSSQASS